MCGIAAILGQIAAARVEVSLRAMLDAQFHRGPDDGGWVVVVCANANTADTSSTSAKEAILRFMG